MHIRCSPDPHIQLSPVIPPARKDPPPAPRPSAAHTQPHGRTLFPCTCVLSLLLARARLSPPPRRAPHQVEGKVIGKYGYVVTVAVIEDSSIGKGQIDETSGFVTFKVGYKAIVMRPFRNEVIDVVVSQCTPLGIYCRAGPMTIWVPQMQFPEDESGNVDLMFDGDRKAWVSGDQEVEIREKAAMRIRLFRIDIDANKMTTVGTIKSDYLGLIEAAD